MFLGSIEGTVQKAIGHAGSTIRANNATDVKLKLSLEDLMFLFGMVNTITMLLNHQTNWGLRQFKIYM